VTYDELTKLDLQEELADRQLPTSGNKEELIARLELADAEELATTAEGVNEADEGAEEIQGTNPPPTPFKIAQDPITDAPQASDESGEAGEFSEEQKEEGPQGTVPPPSTGRGSMTGVPAQMQPENQDESVKGKIYDGRGNLLRDENESDEAEDESDEAEEE
jgi:hypothetical protein